MEIYPASSDLRWPTTVTSNTNSLHQIQIHYIKYKFITSNTNSPHQIQIPHIKNKFPTSKSKTQIKWSAVNERKLSPVFTWPSPDRHFVLAHYGGPQLSRQNKMNSRQDNINSQQNMGIVQCGTLSKMEGLHIPRVIVQDLLKEMDPEGTELRRKHRLKRREYQNPGPNYSWHIDGYDKLKCWGFPIHDAIDGFSCKILGLEITRSITHQTK